MPGNGKMRCGPCHRHKTWLQARGLWIDPDKPDKSTKDPNDSNPDVQQDPLNRFDKPFEPAKPSDSDQLDLTRLIDEPAEAA